jgi:selenocysteine lyase/cysteine desulfurase
VQAQAWKLRQRLAQVPGATVTDIRQVQSGIVTFTIDSWAPEDIKNHLKSRSINVTTSSVSSTRFDMEDRGLEKVVRSSVHYLTTDEEIDALIAALTETR